MRKLLLLIAIVAAFACCQTSYGMGRVLVFKGSVKASKTVFDVNDTNNLLSSSLRGYWIVNVDDTDSDTKGMVISSSAVIYDPKTKYYKVMPDSIDIDPFDPCGVVLLNFYSTDPDGELSFYAVGKGKLTKFSNDSSVDKDFVPVSLKGTGTIESYDFFDPAYTYSGAVMVSIKLDSKWTRAANPDVYSNVDDLVTDIVDELTSKGGWTEWSDLSLH